MKQLKLFALSGAACSWRRSRGAKILLSKSFNQFYVILTPEIGGSMSEGWTEINTSWKGDLNFIGENEAGGSVQMGTLDGKPGVGPMQLLLAGLAGCTGMDIVSILKKKRAELTDFKVKVRGKRAEIYPMIWTDIEVTYYLWGEGLKPKDVEQAIQLSEEKYCSVGIMLAKAAHIHFEYRILEPGEVVG